MSFIDLNQSHSMTPVPPSAASVLKISLEKKSRFIRKNLSGLYNELFSTIKTGIKT